MLAFARAINSAAQNPLKWVQVIVLLIVETSVASAIRKGAVNPGNFRGLPSEAGDTNTERSPVAAQPKQCQLQNEEHKPNTLPLFE